MVVAALKCVVGGGLPTTVGYFNGWGEVDHDQKANLILHLVDAWRAGSGPDDDTLKNAELVVAGLLERPK